MNTYGEIIKANGVQFCAPHSWWAKYAFHYTDIKNAVSILKSGILYSRSKSTEQQLMQNDNASRQVIDMTSSGAVKYVRFYFRPLTPTQYHNEGYKHPEIRYGGDSYANVPVPIFFLFDLQTMLEDPNTFFSEKSQAGIYTPKVLHGIEDFERLNFFAIYSIGPMSDSNEEKKYRQAEILYPEKYHIDKSLKYIVVRNEVDKLSLLQYLKTESRATFEKYKDKIRIHKEFLFLLNGLSITSVDYYNAQLQITFNNSRERHKFFQKQAEKFELFYGNAKELSLLSFIAVIRWKNGKNGNNIIQEGHATGELDYLFIENLTIHLPIVQSAKILELRFEIEGDMICDIEVPILEKDIF